MPRIASDRRPEVRALPTATHLNSHTSAGSTPTTCTTTRHLLLTADYLPLTGKGLDNTNYRAAVAGAVSGAYHVRAMAEQYGVPVRE